MENQLQNQQWLRSGYKSIVKVILFYVFLSSMPACGQLNIFDLQVTKTDETCLGNGSLTFTTNNATPLASFLFTVYKFPNLNVPVSVTASNVLGSLNAGTYKIVATQTLGNLVNADEEQVVIESAIVPLAYSVNVSNQNCSQGAQITLNATSGSIVECEIISGPQTRPLQSSNVFSQLPEGTYNIRAFNDCGEAVVTTYTLILNNAELSISDAIPSTGTGSDCNTVSISNIISAPEGNAISYPISVEYTVHPPNGGADIIFSQQYSNGSQNSLQATQEFPLFDNEEYTYDIQVTDNCNVVFTKNAVVVDTDPKVEFQDIVGMCGKFFVINVINARSPLSINFISPPPGFNIAQYNSDYPGPYNTGSIQFGDEENHVPAGTYIVEVTDACGRIITGQYTVEELLPQPSVDTRNNGCYSSFGSAIVSISGRLVVSAEIVSAPQGYIPALPQNVSNFINQGRLRVTNLPIGSYQIKVTDSCGNEYLVIADIPPFTERDFTATAIPFCTEGIGSVQIISGNGDLTTVTVTAAPASFTEELPFDVSSNIASNGKFFMGDLPEGDYTFTGIDECGIQRAVSVTVTGYHPDAIPFTFVPNCGSFDIVMSDNESASTETTYWMQKQHPLTGLWGHPVTGSTYEAGLPTDADSFPLVNNATTYNLVYQGKFRIVKSFKSYATATGEQYCIEAWEPFTFNMDLKIDNVYNLACTGNPNNVHIEAVNGLAPYSYRIVEKDENPFIVDNGNNSVFLNLEPGVYKFEVTDACQSIDNIIVDVNQLPSLVTANLANDMLICAEPGEGPNQSFNLTDQNNAILGGQHPEMYTVSYHLTLADADSNTNPLPEDYTNISNPQTIYARVIHNSISICHDITSFQLHVNEKPALQSTTKFMCENEPVYLTAADGFDHYEWSTGETTQTILVDTPGTYTVTVTELITNIPCYGSYDIIVAPSGAATIVSVDTEDWTYDQNTITVNTSGAGSYEYSLDGVTYQDNPHFNGLTIGDYTVYVKDKNGCGITEHKVLLLNYPNFFTPNGDGTHDKWRIKYASMEPDMEIDIFDRYGKLVISLNPEGDGWDGTYNGKQLPSTDYWFVVTRANGQVHKGHFSMLR